VVPQETPLKCNYCCQAFSRLDNFKRHESGCKERQCVVRHLEVQLEIPIEVDIHSKQCRFCKKEFTQKCNCTRHMITCKMKMKMKYLSYLEDKLKEQNKENMKGVTTSITNNNSTNTNCNNVTNNIINVKGIGEEDLSYLTVKVIKALSNEFKSDQEFIAKTLAHIHANWDHPENHNIIYSNYSSNKALVKYDNEFKYTNINIVLRQTVENMLDNVALSVDFDKLPRSVKQRLEVVAEDDELDQEKRVEKFTNKPNAIEYLESTGKHKKLLNLLEKENLTNSLKSGTKMTIFAPTDNALSNVKIADKKTFLLQHVLQYSQSPPPNYRKMKTYKTLSGEKVDSEKLIPQIEKGMKTSSGIVFSIHFFIS